MRSILNILFLLALSLSVFAQREIVMSQYMYNKYSINPAFGGSHDVLSVFGSYHKQWLGFDNSPTGSLFTIHSPMKNEKVALGLNLYGEKYAVSSSAGFSFSYTYRMFLKKKRTLALGVSGGLINYASNWNEVVYADYSESYVTDDVFSSSEQSMSPWIGCGVAWYSPEFFIGLSVPNLVYYDVYYTNTNTVDFNKLDYLLTGGYLFTLNDILAIQPSALLRVNPDDKTFADISGTVVYMDRLFLGVSYRTTQEIIGIIGCNINPQLRCTYSLDYNMSNLGKYNNGTHEISFQFDFGYKIKTPNPKYF